MAGYSDLLDMFEELYHSGRHEELEAFASEVLEEIAKEASDDSARGKNKPAKEYSVASGAVSGAASGAGIGASVGAGVGGLSAYLDMRSFPWTVSRGLMADYVLHGAVSKVIPGAVIGGAVGAGVGALKNKKSSSELTINKEAEAADDFIDYMRRGYATDLQRRYGPISIKGNRAHGFSQGVDGDFNMHSAYTSERLNADNLDNFLSMYRDMSKDFLAYVVARCDEDPILKASLQDLLTRSTLTDEDMKHPVIQKLKKEYAIKVGLLTGAAGGVLGGALKGSSAAVKKVPAIAVGAAVGAAAAGIPGTLLGMMRGKRIGGDNVIIDRGGSTHPHIDTEHLIRSYFRKHASEALDDFELSDLEKEAVSADFKEFNSKINSLSNESLAVRRAHNADYKAALANFQVTHGRKPSPEEKADITAQFTERYNKASDDFISAYEALEEEEVKKNPRFFEETMSTQLVAPAAAGYGIGAGVGLGISGMRGKLPVANIVKGTALGTLGGAALGGGAVYAAGKYMGRRRDAAVLDRIQAKTASYSEALEELEKAAFILSPEELEIMALDILSDLEKEAFAAGNVKNLTVAAKGAVKGAAQGAAVKQPKTKLPRKAKKQAKKDQIAATTKAKAKEEAANTAAAAKAAEAAKATANQQALADTIRAEANRVGVSLPPGIPATGPYNPAAAAAAAKAAPAPVTRPAVPTRPANMTPEEHARTSLTNYFKQEEARMAASQPKAPVAAAPVSAPVSPPASPTVSGPARVSAEEKATEALTKYVKDYEAATKASAGARKSVEDVIREEARRTGAPLPDGINPGGGAFNPAAARQAATPLQTPPPPQAATAPAKGISTELKAGAALGGTGLVGGIAYTAGKGKDKNKMERAASAELDILIEKITEDIVDEYLEKEAFLKTINSLLPRTSGSMLKQPAKSTVNVVKSTTPAKKKKNILTRYPVATALVGGVGIGAATGPVINAVNEASAAAVGPDYARQRENMYYQ